MLHIAFGIPHAMLLQMHAFVVFCCVVIQVNGDYTQDEMETTEEKLRELAVHSTSKGWENVAGATKKTCAEKGECPAPGDVGLSVVQASLVSGKILRKDEESENLLPCTCDGPIMGLQESISSRKENSAWGCRNRQQCNNGWCHFLPSS